MAEARPHGAYDAPAAPARGEIREKGSRFLAEVHPVADEAAAKVVLEAIRQQSPDATHHCWAWRLGPPPPRERSSDAGEPAGTAGVPMLQVLRGAELSDVVAVVTRWYGGTKLGKGGLARAYAATTLEALNTLTVGRRVPTVRLQVELPYELLGAVKRLVHPPAVELAEERYGETVELELMVWKERRTEIESALADLGLLL